MVLRTTTKEENGPLYGITERMLVNGQGRTGSG